MDSRFPNEWQTIFFDPENVEGTFGNRRFGADNVNLGAWWGQYFEGVHIGVEIPQLLGRTGDKAFKDEERQ